MFIATQLAQVGASSKTQEEFDAAYVRWEIESAVLGAELRAYYPGDSVHTEWTRCAELTSAYYAQSGMKDRDRRNRYLQDVQQRIDLPADVDLTVVDDLRAETLRARDRVIQGVLESEVI
jgi:hypothetical protein